MLLSIFLSATLNQSDHLLHALDVNSPTLTDFISYISEIFNVYFAKQSMFRDNPTSHTLLNKKEEYENKNLIYAKKNEKFTSLDNDSKSIHRLSVYSYNYLVGTYKLPLPYAISEQLPILFNTFLHKNCLI